MRPKKLDGETKQTDGRGARAGPQNKKKIEERTSAKNEALTATKIKADQTERSTSSRVRSSQKER
jgi:hypothetical protein